MRFICYLKKHIGTGLFLFFLIFNQLYNLTWGQQNYSQLYSYAHPVQKDTIKINEKLNEDLIDSIIYEYDTIVVKGDTIRYTDTLVVFIDDTVNYLFSFGIFYLPFYPVNFNTTLKGNNTDYSDILNETSSMVTGNSAGIDFSVSRNIWQLQAGLFYSQYREKYEHKTRSYIYDTVYVMKTDTIEEYFVVTGNDTTWFYETEDRLYPVFDSTRIEMPFFNRYSYIEFPLIFGIEKSINRRFSYSVKTGPVIGIYINTSSKLLSVGERNEIIEIERKTVMSKLYLNWLTNLEITYHFSKRLALLSGIYHKHNITSLYKKDYPVTLRCSSIGLKIGLKYYL